MSRYHPAGAFFSYPCCSIHRLDDQGGTLFLALLILFVLYVERFSHLFDENLFALAINMSMACKALATQRVVMRNLSLLEIYCFSKHTRYTQRLPCKILGKVYHPIESYACFTISYLFFFVTAHFSLRRNPLLLVEIELRTCFMNSNIRVNILGVETPKISPVRHWWGTKPSGDQIRNSQDAFFPLLLYGLEFLKNKKWTA